MSQRSPDFDTAVAYKIMDFVSDREREARRWTFRDKISRLGYDYVEFHRDEANNVDNAFLGFPPLGEYFITLHLKDPQRLTGEPLPFVSIALNHGELSIAGSEKNMRGIVENYRHDPATFSYAANVFLDKLAELKEAGIMVPAGRR